MSNDKGYKKFDTYSQTTYLVRLATDPKVFPRDDKGEDVVLTFCDNSRIENTEEMWVDARLHSFHNDLGKRMKKGDVVQIVGKLRFRKGYDGALRGKVYDARLATYAGFERGLTEGDVAASGVVKEDGDPVPPAFE